LNVWLAVRLFFILMDQNGPFVMLEMPNIILASASPRRKRLMQNLGLKFRTIPGNPDVENEVKLAANKKPSAFVRQIALKKAHDVAVRCKNSIVIGADTVIYFSGNIIQKPKNMTEAYKIMRAFSGNKHFVYTGVAVVNTFDGKSIVGYEKTGVFMRDLREADIGAYFKLVDPLDKAGAYGIQEHGDMIIRGINGNLDNVIGLPTGLLKKMIKKMA